MRITVNGQRAEIQIKRSVDISKWNSQKECAIGKERKSMELNHYLDTVRMKVLQIHRETGAGREADHGRCLKKTLLRGGRLSEDAAGGFPGT